MGWGKKNDVEMNDNDHGSRGRRNNINMLVMLVDHNNE